MSDPLTERARALIARFRRQRPLRAGSLLVTILGDSIAPRGGTIALQSLIELAQPFGLTERLVRTSTGRLANEEWVSSERRGRSSYYTLTPQGRARFAEATMRIYGAGPPSWDGEWTVIIVPPGLKSRESLREELSWLGFGQLTPGVFAHPAHRDDSVIERLAALEAGGKLIVMQRARVTHASDTQLIAMGWDLGELARRYRRFIEMFRPIDAALETARGAREEEMAFVLRTLLVHEYRKIHLRDPLLPASLLPAGWAGSDAHELCRSLYAKLFAASERHLSATVATPSGALPRPAREVFARFGGLPEGK